MQVDWNSFTPVSASVGGALIGIAVVLFALLVGRIAGISGIVGGLLQPKATDIGWRFAFIAGVVAAPLAYSFVTAMPAIEIEAGYGPLIIAGLLVGVGTRYGSGCTSGHGVIGLSRRSVRSLVATLAFMLAGFATVYVTRHLLG